MGRYSSDSDSDHSSKYRRKHYRRSRSSSSDSSDSSSHHKKSSRHSKAKRKHRSQSRSRGKDRITKRYKSPRSHSRDRDKHRYRGRRSRSHSSDRYKKKHRSVSREPSRSRSSSSQSNIKPFVVEKAQNIIQKDDFQIEPRFKEGVLDEINSDSFTPKEFSSSQAKGTKFKNVVIDVSADTIQVPPVKNASNSLESIFHSSIIMDQDIRFDKWVKKLYSLRQKAIIDLSHASIT